MQHALLITASPRFEQHQGCGSEQFLSYVFAKMKTGRRSLSWKCDFSPPSIHSGVTQQHQFEQSTATIAALPFTHSHSAAGLRNVHVHDWTPQNKSGWV